MHAQFHDLKRRQPLDLSSPVKRDSVSSMTLRCANSLAMVFLFLCPGGRPAPGRAPPRGFLGSSVNEIIDLFSICCVYVCVARNKVA
jgi:hypothetical protein